MARRKRNSVALERANRRLESLLAISPTLDFGDGMSVAAYAETINALETVLATYNTALSSLDSLADAVNQAEQKMMAMSEKMLLSVAGRYGKASKEYEMAGGSRRYRRRSPAPSPTPSPSPSSTSSNTVAYQPEPRPESTNGSTNGFVASTAG